MIPCPECGRPTEAQSQVCANCGHALANGAAPKPTKPPPEVSGWVIEKVPPEMIEEALGAFNLEEFQADMREIEQTGGVPFEVIIAEVEEMVKRRD